MERMPHYGSTSPLAEEKEPSTINFLKIMQLSEQVISSAKQMNQSMSVSHDEMERICQVGDLLQKEINVVRSEVIRRKNLELILPSPNTQKHLPCSNLLAPTSPLSHSVSSLQPLSSSTESVSGTTSPQPQQAQLAQQDQWGNRKIDPKLRASAPTYVNLTEQMILAQSSKRKRPTEGALFCHNCKTKDTPEWRRGPMGAKTLCNACGIRWRLSQGEAVLHKQVKRSNSFEQQSSPMTPEQPSTPTHLSHIPTPALQHMSLSSSHGGYAHTSSLPLLAQATNQLLGMHKPQLLPHSHLHDGYHQSPHSHAQQPMLLDMNMRHGGPPSSNAHNGAHANSNSGGGSNGVGAAVAAAVS